MELKLDKMVSGSYSVRGTEIVIVKGDPPRYREIQEWWVCIGDDPLFKCKGKHFCVAAIERLLAQFEREPA